MTSERGELRGRLAVWLAENYGAVYERFYGPGMDAQLAAGLQADAVLAEIERTHVLLDREVARAWVDCEQDCHRQEDAVVRALGAMWDAL